jgi:hypothetical protein
MPFGCAMKERGVELAYWATKQTPPSGVQISDHPCGRVVMVRSDHVPARADWFESDVVHEIDRQGKILRSWRVPIDSYPVGVEGDELLMTYGAESQEMLRVSLDGAISVKHRPPQKFLEPHWCSQPYPDVRDAVCAPYQTKPYRALVLPLSCT